MSFELNIKERFDLIHHIGKLPCTLALRYSVDAFQKQIEFSTEEINEKNIKINVSDFSIDSNDPDYNKTFDSVPEGVARSISDWIKRYDIEDMKSNDLVQSALTVFKKVVNQQ